MADENTTPEISDMFEKMFLLGVGAFALTKDKVQGTVDDLVERGRLTREQGKDVVSELADRGSEERQAFMRYIRDAVRSVLDKTDVATKGDIERLESEINILRAEMLGGAAESAAAQAEDLSEGNL